MQLDEPIDLDKLDHFSQSDLIEMLLLPVCFYV